MLIRSNPPTSSTISSPDNSFSLSGRKTINPRNIHEFEERVGPVRNFDTSATALNYFQCFYTEEVFETIFKSTISSPDNSFSLSASAILSTNFNFFYYDNNSSILSIFVFKIKEKVREIRMNMFGTRRIDRNELERQWLNLVGDSDDEEEFEGFEAADIYQHREFDNWRKTINPRNIHELNTNKLIASF
jgi:hypothetical protein